MCDDRELKCLKFVQNNIFCKDKQSIENSYIYKTYLNISNNELKKERDYLVNPEYNKPYFGLLERNREEFESILRVANRNRDTSCFPDFTFENGFIEHFQVTSSIENSKGSKHKRKENQFCRKVDTETKKQVLEWSETSRDAVLHSKSWKFQYPEHSYKFLCESFKRNWENHMESYGKYTGPQKIGIFMVEYSESALEMCENVYCDWINGMAQGDMRKQEKFNEYRLSRDKNLLNYIYQFKSKITYVIFVNYKRIEVICTENIPYLLKLLPWEYSISPQLYAMTVASIYNNISGEEYKKENEADINFE